MIRRLAQLAAEAAVAAPLFAACGVLFWAAGLAAHDKAGIPGLIVLCLIWAPLSVVAALAVTNEADQ